MMPILNKPTVPTVDKNTNESSARTKQENIIQWHVMQPQYTLDDLILDSATKSQILDVISYIQNHDLLFSQWGLEERFALQDGLTVNLYGPPGTGKTMAAHAIAKSLKLPMICVDYAEIESKFVGETSKNLSNLFKTAQNQGAVIFFDEADALLSKRVSNMNSSTDVSVNQTRSVLLNLLNNYRGTILFATNFIQNFDSAFLRRIRYHIQFCLPDATLREQLWRMYVPSKMPCQADFKALAEKFDGVSGSDISNAVFSAAVKTARVGNKVVTQEQFETAILSGLKAKRANEGDTITVTKHFISDQEAHEKLGIGVVQK